MVGVVVLPACVVAAVVVGVVAVGVVVVPVVSVVVRLAAVVVDVVRAVVDRAVVVPGAASVWFARVAPVTVLAGVVVCPVVVELPKNVVSRPLPVIEWPARRSGTVKTLTTMAKARRPVAPATRQRGRRRVLLSASSRVPVSVMAATVWSEARRAGARSGGGMGRSRTPGIMRAVGTRLAVAVTVRIGRRRNSATSATITGAAAAPISVPGPQTRATVNDAAADATLATISVCGEIPLGRR